MKRGETKTFSYTSTTSTDQEVIIYYASQVKALDNLSNLNPSSCILAPATKLTNVEIHSPELYNINVTNNKFLRTINLQDCTTLGTVTATGSSLDLSNCKYLRYCNVYNTALTEVQLNTSGGSLTEIYYPKTLQSLTLIKQRLLETIGLPYGDNGEEVPTSLYNVDIEECPKITRFNTSTDDAISKSFASIYYCNNLTLKNTLDLESLTFDGFTRLTNVTIENMHKLQSVQFNNLLRVGDKATLKYVGFSNCPLLETIELNCTSNDFEIAFAQNSTLNLGGLSSLRTVESNCVIKGLGYLVVPLKLENMFFTNEYGEGFSELKNIWSSAVCTVSITGSTITTQHVIDGFEGIDFAGMNLKNIDLGALVNVPQAINFNLSPTTVNPNFNKNRDGVIYPYLQPIGTLDLSNYTESLARFFDGVDLRQLQLVCSNKLPQTDLSYCFYNSTFDKDTQISAVLNNISTVTNMDHCFYKTSVKDVSILNKINFLAGTSLSYCFAECPNITKLENITLSGNIGDASYMFSGCGVSVINNVSTSCGNIVGMFSNCPNLVTVTNFDANGTTSYESLFEGCSGMSVAPLTSIPGTITNISKMYKNCDGLVSIDGFVLHGNITNASELVAGCDNLINANNVTISGSFYNDIFRGLTSLKYVNNLLINYVGRSMTFAHMFDGCTNLIEMSFHDDSYTKDVISMDYMFRGTSIKTIDFTNVNFEKITSLKYMFADGLMEEFSFTVPKTITSIQGMLSNCRNLKTLRNFNISTNVNVTDWILDTPIENLIDCSFYNQNTSFNNNTTLKTIQGFNYTGNNLSGYFDGCINLKTAELTIGNVVTKANLLFNNCPLLTFVEFNAESDLSNVTTISDMFNGDISLSSIKNLKITNPSTIANNTTLKNCPISNTDGLYINSNSAIQMFRMGSESKITQFTDFELGTECNNLSDAFRDYPLLIKDITLPSHVINVSNTFNNCIAMENIVSNWTNSYDVNNDDDLDNDVVTEGCYEGSNNIKYIDGELYMNEYGELTAMDYIPQEWGGNASYEDNQTVFDVKITEDNLTYTMLGNIGECKTNWGDGTEDMNISHEYSKPGTYIIITENVSTFAQGTKLDTSISSPIVRFRALNKSLTKGSHLFDGWNNLLKINKLDNTFDSASYMFRDCSKLTSIDLSGCTFTSKVTNMSYLFMNCSKLSSVNFTIPEGVTDISYMFYGCKSMESISLDIPYSCQKVNYLFYMCTSLVDISGTVFGSRIVFYDNWYLGAPIIKANNLTIKNNNIKFKNFNNLRELNNILITGNVTSLSDFASYTPQLEIFSFNPDSDLSNIVSISNAFYFAGNGSNSLSEISFKGMNLSSLAFMDKTFYGNNTALEKIDFSDCTFGNNTINMVTPFSGNKKENIILDFSRTKMWKMTSYPEFIKGLTGCSMLFTGADFEYTDSFNSVFKFDEGLTGLIHVDFTDAIIPTHITDFTSMFEGTGIDEDIILPLNAQNVTRAFYGCINITHVHSNWKNTYANGITATDCYAGCTEITHVDGVDIGKSIYVNGLDDIPPSWGGYGMYAEYTTICEFIVPDTDLTLAVSNTTSSLTDDKIIDWGDGTVTYGVLSHTYASSGTYVVKGKYWFSNANLTWARYVHKVIKVTQQPISMFYTFNHGSTELVYVDLSNATLTDVRGGLQGGGKLTEVIFNNTKITSTDLNKTFANKSIETWDLSGITFVNGLTSLDSVFNGCSKLKKIIGLDKWDTSRVQSFSAIFANCTLLEDFSFFKNWDLSSLTNANSMFAKCTSLKYPPLTTFGNPNKPTTTVGYSQIYEQTTFPVDNSIQWKVVGACNMYRVFVQNNYVSQFNVVWETDEVVNVPGLFCEGRGKTTSLKTFNLTSCGQSIFTGFFFGGIGSQVNANLTNFECCGTQKYNLNLSLYPNLSKQSLLNVINCLCTTTNTLTLTLGSTNMAKLTEAEIAIATAKGWTVA